MNPIEAELFIDGADFMANLILDNMKNKINNNIEEDRCSFEVSKLLKEKGFSVPVNSYYRISGDIRFGAATHYDWNHPKDQDDYYISCPTHALAIKWIRENFGFQITSSFSYSDAKTWVWSIEKIDDEEDTEQNCWISGMDSDIIGFKEYHLAIEDALLYTLKNLI